MEKIKLKAIDKFAEINELGTKLMDLFAKENREQEKELKTLFETANNLVKRDMEKAIEKYEWEEIEIKLRVSMEGMIDAMTGMIGKEKVQEALAKKKIKEKVLN